MRNLKKADLEPKAFLQDIIQTKKEANNKRLNKMKSDLEMRYDEYVKKADSNKLHLLSEKWHYDKNAKESDGYFLYHQYDNSKASMSDLRAKIIEANNGEVVLKCPICELRDATDLDHYVPRQLFPEYSIHSFNLIPTCHECNNIKSAKWCEQNKRLIFNAYYDTPTNEALFDVTVKKENKLLRMILSLKSFENPKEDTRIALATIENLDLMPYVNQKINEKFSKKLRELITRKKHSKKDVGVFLKEEREIMEDSITEIDDVNNWDRIVLQTIKDNPIVEEWLKEQ